MTRHIAYRRVSTNQGAQSTERQLFDSGVTFDLEFEDKQSGSSANKRVEFKAMLAEVKSGDTIHVQSNDRCFRNTREMLGFVEDMMCAGVTVKMHSENLEFNAHGDPLQIAMSKMVLTSMASISEFFLAKLSSDIKQGIASGKAKGRKFGAANANWQASNAGKLNEARQTKAKYNAEAYRAMVKGILAALPKPTYKGVAKALTAACVELPSGVVGEWKPAQVQRILNRLEISMY